MSTPSTPSIRILLLDDHVLFRESLARLLAAEPDFDVVAQCGSIESALEQIATGDIDLVLLDLDLGSENGSDFARRAGELGFTGKMLVVTAGVAMAEAAELVRAGIAGIFMKHHSAATLAREIRSVVAGRVSFDHTLLHGVMDASTAPAVAPRSRPLTVREQHVLAGIFEGLGNKEIAARLGVSESSVKATLQQLFAKTGVRTRSQLVRIALEQRW